VLSVDAAWISLSTLWLIVPDGPEFSVHEPEEQAQRQALFRFSKWRTSPPWLKFPRYPLIGT
jgi:hypothetical protein